MKERKRSKDLLKSIHKVRTNLDISMDDVQSMQVGETPDSLFSVVDNNSVSEWVVSLEQTGDRAARHPLEEYVAVVRRRRASCARS